MGQQRQADRKRKMLGDVEVCCNRARGEAASARGALPERRAGVDVGCAAPLEAVQASTARRLGDESENTRAQTIRSSRRKTHVESGDVMFAIARRKSQTNTVGRGEEK